MVVAVIAFAVLGGIAELSMNRQSQALVQDRADLELATVHDQLGEWNKTMSVSGELIAANTRVVQAMQAYVDDVDPGPAAQAVVPLKSRLELGFVAVHSTSGPAFLALGDADGIDAAAMVASARAGVSISSTRLGDHGLVAAAAVPVKGTTGILGVLVVGRSLDEQELSDITAGHDLDLVVRNDGRILTTSSPHSATDRSELVHGASRAEISLAGEAHLVQATEVGGAEVLALVSIQDVRREMTLRRWARLAVGLGALSLFGGIAFLRTRLILGSLAGMAHLAGRMAAGEYDRRVAPVRTLELDELGVAINGLSGEIQSRIDQLVRQARRDSLTGLPNRVVLRERVASALSGSAGHTCGVAFIDLDDFKHINDSLGHHAGDQLIVAVADILRSCMRFEDLAVRLGGDEFAILVDETDRDGVEALGERLLAALAAPVMIAGHRTVPSASIGIALGRASGRGDVEELLRNADLAMYQAKRQGKRAYVIYHPDMHAAMLDRLELAADLGRALDAGELSLHYQPLIDLRTGAITGAEALLRWQHPTRGSVPPTVFIPLAEETGLIDTIGLWALGTACRQVQQWRMDVYPQLEVSVNVSAHQLRSPTIVADVEAVLAGTRLPARCLTLEITESLLLRHDLVGDLLRAIRALGVRLAIDDFGTGYSSLAYLQRFPVDTIKIDRSFVSPLADPSADALLVGSIIDIARALGADTVGEGIECEEQELCLRSLGCVLGQGYHLGRPMPVADFEALLAVRARPLVG